MHTWVTTAVVSAWIILGVYWFVRKFSNKRTAERSSLGSRLVQVVLMFVSSLLLIVGWRIPFHPVLFSSGLALRILAVAIVYVGLAIAIWARSTLADNWSAMPEFKQGHALIQTGPYAYMRHPIYTGFLTMYLGTAVLVGTWAGLLGLVCLYVAFRIKYQEEEGIMSKHFPEYAAYQKRVKAIVPFLF